MRNSKKKVDNDRLVVSTVKVTMPYNENKTLYSDKRGWNTIVVSTRKHLIKKAAYYLLLMISSICYKEKLHPRLRSHLH